MQITNIPGQQVYTKLASNDYEHEVFRFEQLF